MLLASGLNAAEAPNAARVQDRVAEMVIGSGDTLDALLIEAGIEAELRREIALAIGAEYDLRALRPGHVLSVTRPAEGAPTLVTLRVDDGVTIEVTIDETISSRRMAPVPVIAERAVQIAVAGSISETLEESGTPVRFAVDLAQMLAGTIDFRRDLKGGEPLQLIWREATLPDGSQARQPQLTYAALDLDGRRYEVVWPEIGDASAIIYRDGDVLRVVAPPLEGARLSSVFGRRRHPVLGDVRMHTGVDYAAPKGTLVQATAPGRISYVGRRGGYGRVVEIAHGTDTMTRFAHLSAVEDGLEVGDRVAAGDPIGRVGSTGMATGPNLHYEVRVEGRPVDPLGDERFVARAKLNESTGAAQRLRSIRRRFVAVLRDQS